METRTSSACSNTLSSYKSKAAGLSRWLQLARRKLGSSLPSCSAASASMAKLVSAAARITMRAGSWPRSMMPSSSTKPPGCAANKCISSPYIWGQTSGLPPRSGGLPPNTYTSAAFKASVRVSSLMPLPINTKEVARASSACHKRSKWLSRRWPTACNT